MHNGPINKGTNVKRGRSRGGSQGGKRPPGRNHVFDSNGPEVRVRGTAHQVLEKYLALARDASSIGDRISAEGYYQHAEHYYRVINADTANGRPNRVPQDRRPAEDMLDDDADFEGEDETGAPAEEAGASQDGSASGETEEVEAATAA